jgi:hypothetical protein
MKIITYKMIFFHFLLLTLICCESVQIIANHSTMRGAIYRRRNVHPKKKIYFPNNTNIKTLNTEYVYHPYDFIMVIIAIFFIVVVFV